MPAVNPVEPPRRPYWRRVIWPAARFLLIAVVLGWLYGVVAPHAYPEGRRAGFGLGFVHGAMMPMALPSLVMGNNPPIFAELHTGRTYKLGYIAGINICGLVFFGGAFWRPSPRRDG